MIKTATFGICKLCGCTASNPCYNPKVGFCWWTDEHQTQCSHCADKVIKNDKDTVHCVNDIPDWKEPVSDLKKGGIDMLFILLGVFIFLFIFAVIKENKGNGDDYLMISIIGISSIGFLITLVVILFLLGSYNLTKTSADGEIAIRDEQNALILSQIEPLVEKYLQYEKSTYKELRLTPQTIVALSAYPELKGNEFIQSQMKIIIDNQRIITSLKIKKTRLNSYKLWIFMGE